MAISPAIDLWMSLWATRERFQTNREAPSVFIGAMTLGKGSFAYFSMKKSRSS